MKRFVYSPTLKDAQLRDMVARLITLMLWLGFLWICDDVFNLLLTRLDISLPGPDIIDYDSTMGILLLLMNLVGVAYLISIFFFIWRFFIDAYMRAKPSRTVQLDLEKLGELFGLTVEEVQTLQTRKNQTVEVREDGTIDLTFADSQE